MPRERRSSLTNRSPTSGESGMTLFIGSSSGPVHVSKRWPTGASPSHANRYVQVPRLCNPRRYACLLGIPPERSPVSTNRRSPSLSGRMRYIPASASLAVLIDPPSKVPRRICGFAFLGPHASSVLSIPSCSPLYSVVLRSLFRFASPPIHLKSVSGLGPPLAPLCFRSFATLPGLNNVSLDLLQRFSDRRLNRPAASLHLSQ